MSSCTNSSNIRSTLLSQIIRESSDGKRVAFTVNSTEVGVTSGITSGSVIRFDVGTDRYELSRADNPATAEVVGVVESISGNNYTIVANGLIIYPGLAGVINSYTGGCVPSDNDTDGAGGGADIFFLSDGCDGKLQLVEPTIPGHIVKPVMQRVKVGASGPGQYNAIVLNYIGYEVAQNATSSLTDTSPAGESTYFEKPPLSGYLDATRTYSLSVEDYSELYAAIGTAAGDYEEEVTLVDTGSLPNLAGFVNASVVQNNINGFEYSSGVVKSVDQTNKKIIVKKNSKQPLFDLSYKLRLGRFSFSVNKTNVITFTTPRQEETKKQLIYSDGTKVEVTLKPYIRTNSEITKVSIPSSLNVLKITCDDLITNNQNVGTSIVNFESRISSIERKLGIS